jgi:CubicO group peptidase (beta-lactamase class C family)
MKPTQDDPVPGTPLARLNELVPQLMAQFNVPAVSLAVIRQARVARARAFGHKHAVTREPASPSTVFEAASLSKPLFAYAALSLVEQGALDLDAPLTRYLPEPYVPGEPLLERVTARTVLSHTTGFQNWCWAEGEQLALHCEPGTQFGYSSAAYVYLQRVVERVTGQPLNNFMRRRAFDPLGMRHSNYIWVDDYAIESAIGHAADGQPVPKSHPSEALACASLHTTALDYARFVIEMLAPRETRASGAPLSRAGVDSMLHPQIKLSTAISWGLGWGLEHTASGDCFWHWGDNGSFKAFAIASRAGQSGLVILTNAANGLSLCEPIVHAAFGDAHPAFAWVADFYH